MRRLNRTQVQDILERNISLYREEERFAGYIVDLALYLLEYEYDWADGGIEPPPQLAASKSAGPGGTMRASIPVQTPSPAPVVSHNSYAGVNSSALTAPRSPGISTPNAESQHATPIPGSRKIISPQLRPREMTPAGGLGRLGSNPSIAISCPHCGTPVEKSNICPSCRNMVR